METIADKYTVECTPDGGYYAYLCNHEQCFAYGETEEEVLENLEIAAEEFYNGRHSLIVFQKTHIVNKLPIFSHSRKPFLWDAGMAFFLLRLLVC